MTEHSEADNTCLPPIVDGSTNSGKTPNPDLVACRGVMKCVHVDTDSGAYSVKENEPVPELREGDVLIKVGNIRS